MINVILIVVLIVIAVFALGLFIVLVAAQRLRRLGRVTYPVPADAALVLGAYTDGYRPSRTLADRLKAALHLYRNGMIRYLIVCGGQGQDETVSESSSMKRFLVFNGIPPEVVLEDRHSADTWENLRNGKRVMTEWQLRSAIVVTSDYHLPRALAVAHHLGLDVTGYAAVSRGSELRYAVREVVAIVIYLLTGKISAFNGPDSVAGLVRRLFF